VLAGRRSNLTNTRALRQSTKPCLSDFVFVWIDALSSFASQ
jgi:hypothetical protein